MRPPLHDEGITGGVETAAQDGMHVWIGDASRRMASDRIEPVTTAAPDAAPLNPDYGLSIGAVSE